MSFSTTVLPSQRNSAISVRVEHVRAAEVFALDSTSRRLAIEEFFNQVGYLQLVPSARLLFAGPW